MSSSVGSSATSVAAFKSDLVTIGEPGVDFSASGIQNVENYCEKIVYTGSGIPYRLH